MRAGFIGLGNIGKPMAQRLAVRPGSVRVHDAVSDAMDLPNATAVPSPADVGAGADLVGICVRDDDDVRNVVDGPDGLLRTMRGGGIAVHSTVRPSTIRELAERAAEQDVALIDAAVTGGPDGAARGELTVMAGGTRRQLDLLRPLIEAYASVIVHAGALGAGMTLKLANNLVTYMQLHAALEAYRFADGAGMKPELLDEVMSNNGNLTPAMKAYIQYRQTGPERVGADAFLRSQEALAVLADKDLSLAQETAAEFGMTLPGIEALRPIFRHSVTRV